MPEYPASSISDAQLSEHWKTSFSSLRGVADAAVRHEYETGAAIPKAEHEQQMIEASNNIASILADAKRRELAIAEAVRKATIAASFARGATCHFEQVDLPAIIASVP